MLEQAVLADFMIEGHYIRHLRRMRTLYAERRITLLNATKNMPLKIDSPEAGIHCVGWLANDVDEIALVKQARQHELELTPISTFSIEPFLRKGLLLGYGGYSTQEIKSAARRLGELLRTIFRL